MNDSRKSFFKKKHELVAINASVFSKGVYGFVLLILILFRLPHFFDLLEKRKGFAINDWVLAKMPAYDVSVPIFLIVWGLGLLLLLRAIKDPEF